MKVMIAALVILTLILGYSNYRIESLNQQLAMSRVEASQTLEQLQELQEAIEKVEQQRQEFENKTAEINRQYREVRTELEGMRGREATVLARPTLVERLINRSFQAQQRQLTCLTEGSCDE